MWTSTSFTVSALNKVTDGLWPVVVGVKDPDVVVNEASHKRIFPKIDVVFEDAMNDGGKETANERRSRMESTVPAEGGAHFARRRLSFQ